jgi:hypothetical protein
MTIKKMDGSDMAVMFLAAIVVLMATLTVVLVVAWWPW